PRNPCLRKTEVFVWMCSLLRRANDAGGALSGSSGSPMISHHCQQRPAPQIRAAHGANRQWGERTDKVVNLALVIQDDARRGAIPVCPRPVRNPAKDGAVQSKSAPL